jgi:hypothetical protein
MQLRFQKDDAGESVYPRSDHAARPAGTDRKSGVKSTLRLTKQTLPEGGPRIAQGVVRQRRTEPWETSAADRTRPVGTPDPLFRAGNVCAQAASRQGELHQKLSFQIEFFRPVQKKLYVQIELSENQPQKLYLQIEKSRSN